MTAYSSGYDSLALLLSLLKILAPESKRTIALDSPDRWSASAELKKTPEEKAVIRLTDVGEAWILKNKDGKLMIELNLLGISLFLAGIEKAKYGEYDFSIGGTNGQNLWFW